MIKTFSYRVKDAKTGTTLEQMALSVNVVWNFCNETQLNARRWNKAWPNYATLCELTAGSARGLITTRMAKSILDAGWSAFRTMLRYKAVSHGVVFEEVDEAFSTRTCSECGALGGPKGIAGLGIRDWACTECGVHHDRDVNSAKLIFALGRQRLAGGISAL